MNLLPSRQTGQTEKAFTLIELLVVIGIIGVLAAGIGVAMKTPNPNSAVRNAQGMITSALSVARAQAAIAQSSASLVIQADPNDPGFLRSIRVVVQRSTSPLVYEQLGSEVLLPEGVYVVPPTVVATGVTFSAPGGSWSNNMRSTMLNSSVVDFSGSPSLGANASRLYQSAIITPLGASTGGKLIVAPARRRGPDAIEMDNPDAARGLIVSRYGVATIVNDANSFAQ